MPPKARLRVELQLKLKFQSTSPNPLVYLKTHNTGNQLPPCEGPMFLSPSLCPLSWHGLGHVPSEGASRQQLWGALLAQNLFATIYLCYVHAQLPWVPRSSSWEHQLFEIRDPDFKTQSWAPGTHGGFSELVGSAVAFSAARHFLLQVACYLSDMESDIQRSSETEELLSFLIYLFLCKFSSDQKPPPRSLVHSLSQVCSWDFLQLCSEGVSLTWSKWNPFLQCLDMGGTLYQTLPWLQCVTN